MKPLKFVYVLRHYPQLSQTFVRNEIAGLRALGHDVRVISLRHSDTEHVDPQWAGPYAAWPWVTTAQGVRSLAWWLSHHPLRTLRMLGAARSLGLSGRRRLAMLEVPVVARDLAAAGHVAAVHTHFAWPTSLESTVLLARLLGARSSVTSHARDIYLPPPTVVPVLRMVDAMVTVCRYNVAEMARTGLWSPRRPAPTIVPCGVDVAPIADSTGVAPDRRGLRVVSVGRLIEKKGFADLVTAMVEVAHQIPGATLEIVGEGPDRPMLERQIADLRLGAVVVLRGAAPHTEVLDFIANADVFALACRVDSEGDSDAMPVVLREAMARAIPVVTTDVAGIGESVDEHVGWLLRPGDPQGLAGALVEAGTHRSEAAARGQEGRHRVVASSTTAHTAAGMARFFAL